VNKDQKISNPAASIGQPRSRGSGAWSLIGRLPRGCEDVLNDAPQCTWLTKTRLPAGESSRHRITRSRPRLLFCHRRIKNSRRISVDRDTHDEANGFSAHSNLSLTFPTRKMAEPKTTPRARKDTGS